MFRFEPLIITLDCRTLDSALQASLPRLTPLPVSQLARPAAPAAPPAPAAHPAHLAPRTRPCDPRAQLVGAALEAGLRESGVCAAARRPVVTLRCSIRLEVPVAADGRWIVPMEYLRHLVEARPGTLRPASPRSRSRPARPRAAAAAPPVRTG